MSVKTAKVLMGFIDQVRIAAVHDEQGQNPVQREYEACLSKLSDDERGELVRIINKLTQHLEAHQDVVASLG
jgi:hypothetical protein